MDGGIYLRDGEELVEMTEQNYDAESVLQRNLADFPRLLAGDQMNADEAREWALIAREAGVPDKKGGHDRWSADHLFVDQSAIPTIIEVKRSDDTRVRREVVGQMLDYVSHARLYWDASELQSLYLATCREHDLDPETVLDELTDESDTSGFWEQVESNLRSGKVRLLFVADEVPSELKRVVEFLNEQMAPAEVLAVEVRKYTSADKEAFVPRLLGQTEEARSTKSSTTRPSYAEDDFLEDVHEKESAGDLTTAQADAIRDLYEFIKEEADSYDFGGTANVSVTARWEAIGGSQGMFTINASGYIKFWQPNPDKEDALWTEAEQDEWHQQLAEIDHPEVSLAKFEEKTEIPIDALVDADNREQFKQACRDFAAACEAATGDR